MANDAAHYNEEKLWLASDELLKGAYDLHMHPIPSHFQRSLDDYQALEEAAAAGMAGIALKNHLESTVRSVALLNRRKQVPTQVYGGVVLNKSVGGLNPYAVESALRMGGKFVWMPTCDSAHEAACGRHPKGFLDRKGGVRILDDAGDLLPEVHQIIDLCREYDAVLGTGHISPAESVKVCTAARAKKVKAVLTHPEWTFSAVPTQTQAELAALGVRIEKLWYNVEAGDVSWAQMVKNIRACGVENCFLATDRGQAGKAHPVQALRLFIIRLLESGFSFDEVRTMVQRVPEQLVLNESVH